MCLYTVNQRLAGRGEKIYTGWKVFAKSYHDTESSSQYSFRYFTHEGRTVVPVNKWLKSSERTVRSALGTGPSYDSGFHIYVYPYTAQHQAKFWNRLEAVRVKFRGVVARGREGDTQVVVAREMYVPYRKPGRSQNVNKAKK